MKELKKISLLLLVGLLALAFNVQEAPGTPLGTPITNCTELQDIKNNLAGDYYLANDIDCSDTINWNSGAGFDPMGSVATPFTGSFDGRGYKITALYINRPATFEVGLFKRIGSGSEIKDVGLENMNVNGYRSVASLVGVNYGGTVSNSYSTGSVSGDAGIGSLVAYIDGGTVSNSYSTGSVSGYDRVGGLVGINHAGTISNSYSTGSVSGTYSIGGLLGQNFDGGTVSNSYWDVNTSGQSSSAGGTGKTTAEMKQQATFVGWDFVNIWAIVENVTYPFFRGQDDIAVTNVMPCETVARQGDCTCINVTVENQGDLTETFDVTTYYGMGTIPNGDLEKDSVGTSYDDINDWDYDIVVHKGNPPTGDDLQIVDDYYFEGVKSVYSYLQTTSVSPFPGDSWVSQYLSTEESVSTAADYITLWIGGDGYTTSSRYYWYIELILTDGTDTYSEILRADAWDPVHYDNYDSTETGADGNTWKRYTRSIPGNLDKSNLTIKIRHHQRAWDLTTASSWYRLDSIYFSDSQGNPLALIPIGTKPVTDLDPNDQTTVTFAWNTKGVPLGYYTISAYAHPVPLEIDTDNNTYIDGTIEITPGFIPGDINEDGYVDFYDVAELSVNWLQCNAPGDANCTWEP